LIKIYLKLSDRRSERINFYRSFRSLIWRYQIMPKTVTELIWTYHCALFNAFSQRILVNKICQSDNRICITPALNSLSQYVQPPNSGQKYRTKPSDSAFQVSITLLLNTYFLKSNLLRFYTASLDDLFFDPHHM